MSNFEPVPVVATLENVRQAVPHGTSTLACAYTVTTSIMYEGDKYNSYTILPHTYSKSPRRGSSEEQFKLHSGLHLVDVDNIEYTKELVEKLKSSTYVFAFTRSFSGKGLHIYIKLENKPTNHTEQYEVRRTCHEYVRSLGLDPCEQYAGVINSVAIVSEKYHLEYGPGEKFNVNFSDIKVEEQEVQTFDKNTYRGILDPERLDEFWYEGQVLEGSRHKSYQTFAIRMNDHGLEGEELRYWIYLFEEKFVPSPLSREPGGEYEIQSIIDWVITREHKLNRPVKGLKEVKIDLPEKKPEEKDNAREFFRSAETSILDLFKNKIGGR